MKKISFIFLLGLFISQLAAQTFAKADYQRLDTMSKITDLVTGDIAQPQWSADQKLTFMAKERAGKVFYTVNPLKKTKTVAFNHQLFAENLARISGTKVVAEQLPITLLSVEKDGRMAFKFQGKTWTLNPLDGTIDTTQHFEAKSKDFRVKSPDLSKELFIRDSSLWLLDLKTSQERCLSTTRQPNEYYERSVAWSPDSKYLAAIRVQDAPMHKIYLIESSPKDQLQPILQNRDYYKPGDQLPIYLPAMFDIESGRQIEVDGTPFENQYFLELTGWKVGSPFATLEFNERGHQRYQLLALEPSGKTRVLISEDRPESFIYYNRNYRYDTDQGREILWISERDGWRHLYLFDGRTGALKNQITNGSWVVREVLQVNEKERTILFTAGGINEAKGEDPYNLHLCRINFDGTGLQDLTPENANHNITLGKDYFVDLYSRPDQPSISVLRKIKDGSVVMELSRADISALLATGWTMPEVFMAKGRDGVTPIWGNIYRPTNFDPTKKYPVIEYIYAGPHDSFVNKNFQVYHNIYSRLAEFGFIIVTIDGMGTANRSKAFHDVCWRNLKDSGFPDRILWMQAAAAKYPSMNLENVGIFGYSAGGQSAMAALLFHGDFYKTAISACGCHDNRMDKIWWNEQWMGYPIGKWYEESSNVVNAHRLKGKLLILNGELDDNVDPTSTLQVVNALIKAGKDFEQLYLPGYGHSLGGAYELRRFHDFFVKNMLNGQTPDWNN